jgi:hypothetical protein
MVQPGAAMTVKEIELVGFNTAMLRLSILILTIFIPAPAS